MSGVLKFRTGIFKIRYWMLDRGDVTLGKPNCYKYKLTESDYLPSISLEKLLVGGVVGELRF